MEVFSNQILKWYEVKVTITRMASGGLPQSAGLVSGYFFAPDLLSEITIHEREFFKVVVNIYRSMAMVVDLKAALENHGK